MPDDRASSEYHPVEAEGRTPKTETLEQLRQLAEGGNPAAQNDLGWLYQNGRGVPQDNAEAIKWYRKAAEQDYAIAKTISAGCINTVEVSRKTIWRRSNGIEKLHKTVILPKPKTISAGCISMAEVFRKVIQRRSGGIEKLLEVAIPQPKIILTGCIKRVGVSLKTMRKAANIL